MKKIILEQNDITDFEQKINSLPCFAKNVAENMAVSQAIQGLMQWMASKLVESTEEDPKPKPKPIGGGGSGPQPPKP